MKFTKMLLTVSLSIGILLGLIPRAMSRTEVQGQSSGTSNPTSREKALNGMIILYGTKDNANTSIPPPPMQQLNRNGNFLATGQSQFRCNVQRFLQMKRWQRFNMQSIFGIRSSGHPVPIRIDASFTDFGGFEDETIILGGARPAGWKFARIVGFVGSQRHSPIRESR